MADPLMSIPLRGGAHTLRKFNGLRALGLVLTCLVLAILGCDSAADEGVEVVRYEGPAIDPEESGDWQASIDWTGLVTLQSQGPDGTTNSQLTLMPSQTDELPIFMGLSVFSHTLRYVSLRRGTVAIEHFSLEGVVSGLVDGRLYSGTWPAGRVRFTFWADLSEVR